MFLSLNKKIIYTIFIFFILTGIIFVCTFYSIYLHKTTETQKEIFIRNNQYVSILYENYLLKNAITNFYKTNETVKKDPLISSILKKANLQNNAQKITTEKDKINQLLISFNEKHSTLNEAMKMLSFSSVFIILAGIMLWFLMRKWVISPIQKLSIVSKEINQNNLSTRIEIANKSKTYDEFYNLNQTFNGMLDRLEDSISKIREKETFLQSLIDTIPDGIRVIDKNYNIIIANKEYYKTFEKAKKTCKCYKSLKGCKSRCNFKEAKCPVHELLRSKNKESRIVTSFNDENKKYISINAAPLSISHDTKYVVESLRDLSEDIKFSYNQKLSAMGFLATSVSHEMKNNLGAIRMILEGVIKKRTHNKLPDNEMLDYLEMLHNQILKTIEVPERLLKLNQTTEEQEESVDCIENINDTVALLDYQAKSKGVLINFNHKEEAVHINALNNEFKIIIINLIQNAIQAIDKQGNIVIECFQDNQKVTIKVKDNGRGIKKENLNFIFDPFFTDKQDKKEKGSGLGLTIVKSFVDKFNGEIKVYSQEKIGTTFALTFPNQKKDLQI